MKMKFPGYLPCIIFPVILLSSCKFAENVVKVLDEQKPLTEQEVIQGLREALSVGTDTAVKIVSAPNGFYRDELIKIYLPPEAGVIMQYKDNALLQAIGIGKLIDDTILSMNRAAEHAARSAGPIFSKAIREMTIHDAFAILRGSDSSATQYLRNSTYLDLKNSFQPQIRSSLDQPLAGNISANQAWESLTSAYNNVAVMTGWNKVTTQLDDYVTTKALNGLFIKIRDEEKEIRTDPKARVTQILRRVFG
jgi:hypothetical protein